MIEISNLRKYYTGGGMARLEVDMTFTDMDSPYSEKTIYLEIAKEHEDLLDGESYNAFVLIPLYLAMYHKQPLHICGKISKQLYHNVKWYIWKILCDYSPALSPVEFIVDGFIDPPKERGKIIGTGFSCGVDSFTTVYDHFAKEEDLDYRINTLFYFRCDGHNAPRKRYKAILSQIKPVAEVLYLPLYTLDTNFSYFQGAVAKMRNHNTSMNFLAFYSCVLSMGRKISKYYISSASSYEQIKEFSKLAHDNAISSFSESYLIPLIRTECTELIIDGCQYRRVDKTKRIADWEIAKKYLNVCWENLADGSNCGKCSKCLRTLFALEVLGKIDEYSALFDLKHYYELENKYKLRCLKGYGKDHFSTENVDFARENNFPMPTLEKK